MQTWHLHLGDSVYCLVFVVSLQKVDNRKFGIIFLLSTFCAKNEVTLDRFAMYCEKIKGHFIEFLISNIFG